MVDCAIFCIKCIILTFNFLFLLIGVSLCGGGIYVIAADYPTEIHAGYVILYAPAVPYVLAVVGLTMSVLAFVGCYGDIMQKTFMLSSFSVVMLVLLVTELGFGLYALINYDVLIEKGLFTTLDAAKDQEKMLDTWEGIQLENKCCGVNQPSDWEPIFGQNKYMPPTCCPKNWSDKDMTKCIIKDATKIGCKQKIVDFVRENLIIWISISFGVVILVQFVGIKFTCILYYTNRKKYHGLDALYN